MYPFGKRGIVQRGDGFFFIVFGFARRRYLLHPYVVLSHSFLGLSLHFGTHRLFVQGQTACGGSGGVKAMGRLSTVHGSEGRGMGGALLLREGRFFLLDAWQERSTTTLFQHFFSCRGGDGDGEGKGIRKMTCRRL